MDWTVDSARNALNLNREEMSDTSIYVAISMANKNSNEKVNIEDIKQELDNYSAYSATLEGPDR